MKKLNKLVAILVAMAMVLSLSIVSAFALSNDSKAMTDDDAAYLVKYLKIKEGITVPNETFQFKFDAYEAAAATADTPAMNSSTVKKADVPAIANKEIAARSMTASGSAVDDGALVGTLKIADILTGISFPYAGEYIYKVTEVAGANELMDYSGQTYYLHVYVKNGTNGTEVAGVTVEEEQDPEEPATDPTYEKKDITDQDPSDGDDDTPNTADDKTQTQIDETNADGFTFVNQYDKNGTLNKNGAFVVSKAVAGDYAKKTYEYPFTITLSKPASNANAKAELDAYIMKTTDANADYATKGTKKTVKLGDSATFKLADGYKLVIPELPDGTTVDVTENLNTATDLENLSTYKASFKVTDNGTEDATATEGSAGAALAATQVTVNDTDTGANAAAYTNTSTYEPTPTGILISNLPYIALAFVAIGGLVAYVVVRRRQDDEA